MSALILGVIAIAAFAYAMMQRRRRNSRNEAARTAKLKRTAFVDGKPSYLRPSDDDSYGNFRSRDSKKEPE